MDSTNGIVADKNENSENVARNKIVSPSLPTSKESSVEEMNKTDCTDKGKAQVTSPKSVATSVTKNKDWKAGLASPKKPLASPPNRRPSLDGHNPRYIKSIGSLSPIKLLSKSCRLSPTLSPIDSAGTREQEQSPQFKENSPSSSSPTETRTKPRRSGSLPSYGFTFRCEERAQKRKEFISKIEEKNHAKELEKSVIEEKCKENQDSDIKMLRKSLSFKATPLPSFYRDPAPPKVELKKIPTTRAISPKLGRSKRSATMTECEENGNNAVCHSRRASLDGRGARSQATSKGMTNQQSRRQSLSKVGCAREHEQIQNVKRWVL